MHFGYLARSLGASGLALATAVGLGLVAAQPARAAEVWTYQGWHTIDGASKQHVPTPCVVTHVANPKMTGAT